MNCHPTGTLVFYEITSVLHAGLDSEFLKQDLHRTIDKLDLQRRKGHSTQKAATWFMLFQSYSSKGYGNNKSFGPGSPTAE